MYFLNKHAGKLFPLKELIPGTPVKCLSSKKKTKNTNQNPEQNKTMRGFGKLPHVFISSWLNRFPHYDWHYFTLQREAHV